MAAPKRLFFHVYINRKVLMKSKYMKSSAALGMVLTTQGNRLYMLVEPIKYVIEQHDYNGTDPERIRQTLLGNVKRDCQRGKILGSVRVTEITYDDYLAFKAETDETMRLVEGRVHEAP